MEPQVLDVLVAQRQRFLAFLTPRVGSPGEAEEVLQAAFVRGLEKGEGLHDAERAVCGCVAELAGTLKPEYTAIVRRVDLEGVSVSTFAQEAGLTPNNAAVRLHRARQALGRRLRESLGVWSTPASIRWVGWGVAGGALLVTMVAQAQMGTSWRIGIDRERTELVTGGLFAVVRNPIFTDMLLVVTGIALVTPSAWTVMAWADYVLLVSLQVRLEEEHLMRLHGEAYRAYASRVGRFLPGVGRLPARFQAGGVTHA
ncbi:methyltransferase [Archangium gephyra]|uniref:methyltransferase n=1 Tax=Archangium gephyra TaxID=48 RepID=UPI003B788549